LTVLPDDETPNDPSESNREQEEHRF
jgi:hypothetical protein